MFGDILLSTVSTTLADSSSYDVIVLGYGCAGASAALQAAHLGAKVLVVEKSSTGGGNSFSSSANITYPQDFENDAEKYTDYLEESTQHTTPREVVVAFTKGLYEMESWLNDLGGELEDSNYDKM